MASYERLSALDRFFLDVESSNTHMHVAAVMLFDAGPLRNSSGGIDIDRIRKYVASRLHLIPRYRHRIKMIPIENHPVWVDDDQMNIRYHVRHTSLPRPGSLRQLKRLAGRVMSQKLDRSKPLWEFWVIEGLENDRFAVITKTHHCMIDGDLGRRSGHGPSRTHGRRPRRGSAQLEAASDAVEPRARTRRDHAPCAAAARCARRGETDDRQPTRRLSRCE